jgi:cellobiose transport system permease protein
MTDMTDSSVRDGAATTVVAAPGAGPKSLPSPARQKLSRFNHKAVPYLYVSPFFVVFALVGLFPMAFTLFISLFDWKLTTQSAAGAQFVGLGNYTDVLFGDSLFWSSLLNTFSIFLISTVPQLVVATLIAVMLDHHLRARTFWRMGVLLPYIVAPVATAIIFSAVFRDPHQGGLANSLLQLVGLEPQQWHADRLLSHVAIATMVNFRWTGYNALILLAAMQAVPRDLYEAAAIDGANAWRRFWSVTLPSIRGTMIFVVLTATMGGLRIFDEIRMYDPLPGANGGPGGVFRTVVFYLWNVGFSAKAQLGKAAAIAWLLFFIILLVTALNFWLSSRISGQESTVGRRGRRRAAVTR